MSTYREYDADTVLKVLTKSRGKYYRESDGKSRSTVFVCKFKDGATDVLCQVWAGGKRFKLQPFYVVDGKAYLDNFVLVEDIVVNGMLNGVPILLSPLMKTIRGLGDVLDIRHYLDGRRLKS